MTKLLRFPTSLIGPVWANSDGHRYHLVVPARERLDLVDRQWPPLREEDDDSRDWPWAEIMRRARDRFALVRESDDETAVLFCSKRSRILCDGAWTYRPWYFEAHPAMRGQRLGVLALALMVARAREAGCSRLLLDSVPRKVAFYERWYGRPITAGSCIPRRSPTISVIFEGEGFTKLEEHEDAFRE